MDLPAQIARILTADLGENTADSVARHLCAKHGVGAGDVEPARLKELRETLRRGLVAFVGEDRARSLADACFDEAAASTPSGDPPA